MAEREVTDSLQQLSLNGPNGPPTNQRIERYLSERSQEFKSLAKIRRKGWQSEEATRRYDEKRKRADEGGDDPYFYNMMKQIGQELQQATEGFTVGGARERGDDRPEHILDTCAAPGGFLFTAMNQNPDVPALVFSLPAKDGGYKLLLPRSPLAEIKFTDVTMLAGDMDTKAIPDSHPDHDKFVFETQIPEDHVHDLALCDGQVLRKQARAEYRQEQREARRLIAAQLFLALNWMKSGGTLIIRLHKLEDWLTINLLSKFEQIGRVQLFKPTSHHAASSSFYVVVSDIGSLYDETQDLIKEMKDLWHVATFGTEDEYAAAIREDDAVIKDVLESFGERLIELATPIWKIQDAALRNADYNRPAGKEHLPTGKLSWRK